MLRFGGRGQHMTCDMNPVVLTSDASNTTYLVGTSTHLSREHHLWFFYAFAVFSNAYTRIWGAANMQYEPPDARASGAPTPQHIIRAGRHSMRLTEELYSLDFYTFAVPLHSMLKFG